MTSSYSFQFSNSIFLREIAGTVSQDGMVGQLVNCSNNVMKLFTSRGVPAEAWVQVDVTGGLVLGRVKSCREENSTFQVEVHVEQVVPAVSDLAKLFHAVQGDRPPVAPEPGSQPAAAEAEPVPVWVSRPPQGKTAR